MQRLDQMKFSVLLNNYNYQRYLGSAIESVLNQTYGDFELIIVDDGSTDDSKATISSYHDFRIIPIFKENGGQGSAFKAGFRVARGDYIAFLDADDIFAPNKLEQCALILDREPDIVLLNHGYQRIDRDGNPTGQPVALSQTGVYELKTDLRLGKIDYPLVPTSFFVGRRTECAQLDFDEQQWRIAADTPVIVGLALSGKTFNLPECLGFYRSHGANASSTYDERNTEGNYRHVQRLYQLANEGMERLGDEERFDFSKTDLALNRRILNTNKYSLLGVYYRALKRLRNLLQRPISLHRGG